MGLCLPSPLVPLRNREQSAGDSTRPQLLRLRPQLRARKAEWRIGMPQLLVMPYGVARQICPGRDSSENCVTTPGEFLLSCKSTPALGSERCSD